MKNSVKTLTGAGVIAALYVIATYLTQGFAFGFVQIRLAEALTVLPIFSFAAVPGVFVGCLLSNILAGGNIFDVIFGTLATLMGAVGTYYAGKIIKNKPHLLWIGSVPPILANTLVIPLVLTYAYGLADAVVFGIPVTLPIAAVCVFVGELISCGVIGTLLAFIMYKLVNTKQMK